MEDSLSDSRQLALNEVISTHNVHCNRDPLSDNFAVLLNR